MKLQGFIGPTYKLNSVNVDAQRTVNLVPEIIESGTGKELEVAYFKHTPGLEPLLEVGSGPIRLIHQDSIGRIFVVSGNRIYLIGKKNQWRFLVESQGYPAVNLNQSTDINGTTDIFTSVAHPFYDGQPVRLTSTTDIPSGLSAGVTYYIIRLGNDTFQLSGSVGGAAINFGGVVAGTLTVTPQTPNPIFDIEYSLIDFTNHTFFKADHGLRVGQKIRLMAAGSFPNGIDDQTDYFAVVVSDNQFKLATSYVNAVAETAVSFTDIDDAWVETIMGRLGSYGGEQFILKTLSGPVKAASMSLGGMGTDASTVFVDGAGNYLLRDENGTESLGPLGDIQVAEAVFDIDDDITVFSTENIDNFVNNISLKITHTGNASFVPAGTLLINFFTNGGQTEYFLNITSGGFETLSTEELVSYANEGFVFGKTIAYNNFDNSTVDPTRVPLALGMFSFSGGGTQQCTAAFGSGGITESFSEETYSGLEYGSVPTATDIVWSDGYFIVNEGGTNRFRVSDLQDFNMDELSFAAAEGSPDLIQALEVVNRYLYILNEETTEVYANTGNADFPFERIASGFIEVGCLAAQSVAKIDGALCWLGRSEDGEGIVYTMRGIQYQRISTHAVEQAIQKYANPQTASAFAYQDGGHAYYVLNFEEATWVYDFSTRLWHERAFTNNDILERHRAEHHAFDTKRGIHLVGDYSSNKIYKFNDQYYLDDLTPITRLRRCPYLSAGLKRITCYQMQLDMETGVATGSADRSVILSWSDDGGHTWKGNQAANIGLAGAYQTRVMWRRLGNFRDRVFEFKTKIQGPVTFLGAHMEVEGGNS